ncbi:hypothetical protein B6U71_00435 [Euryarchaeota archaeon ex4484_178]|nr:MAG: hypothetical protein B6U71_00435 [Euryarchaeota archaeon ex4484_178]
MDLTWLLMETSLGNIVWHLILGIIVSIFILHRMRNGWLIAITLPLFMELIIDGFHLINKNLTHNLIVLWQIPLILLLLDYMYDENRKYTHIFLSIFGISLTHLFSDAVLEGDSVSIFYPFTAQTYAYRTSVAGINAALLGALLLFLSIGVLYIVSNLVAHSTSSSSSWPQRKEMRRYSFPSFITTVAFFILAL